MNNRTPKTDLTPRELFKQVMRFQCPGKTMATLGGIWPSTLQRWREEGMPPELKDMNAIWAYLGLQPHRWEGPKAEIFAYPHFERKVVAETDDKITYVNPWGVVCTDFKVDAYKSMPHFEHYPIAERADWEAYKHRLKWDDARIGPAWAKQREDWRTTDLPIIAPFNRGGSLYGTIRDLAGVERASLLFYDDPDLVAEIMDTLLELFCQSVRHLFTDFAPEAICLWEDMAYRNGSLLSPKLMREFMLPRYRVMVQELRAAGVEFIVLDSDGYIDELIPIWLEAGIDGVVPMEAQCGMDVAVYRERYPRMLMMGGVDKRALAGGRPRIDREMDKIARAVAVGGLVPWFDHGLPHDVSYEDFLYYVERLKDVSGIY